MYKTIVYTLLVIVFLSIPAPYIWCADSLSDGFIYDSRGKRDPFVPLIGQERSAGAGLETVVSFDDLRLEGIATGIGGRQVAIINGQMVKEKDKFGALLIKKISRKQVDLSIEGRDYALTLQEPEKENAGNKK
ncbi:MAG: hypothetical protein Q8R38_07240 [Candidatus Omnitrophota bacterium]|nr:hypothetical protein [Candidatus Omnitrophota bacterium]